MRALELEELELIRQLEEAQAAQLGATSSVDAALRTPQHIATTARSTPSRPSTAAVHTPQAAPPTAPAAPAAQEAGAVRLGGLPVPRSRSVSVAELTDKDPSTQAVAAPPPPAVDAPIPAGEGPHLPAAEEIIPQCLTAQPSADRCPEESASSTPAVVAERAMSATDLIAAPPVLVPRVESAPAVVAERVMGATDLIAAPSVAAPPSESRSSEPAVVAERAVSATDLNAPYVPTSPSSDAPRVHAVAVPSFSRERVDMPHGSPVPVDMPAQPRAARHSRTLR